MEVFHEIERVVESLMKAYSAGGKEGFASQLATITMDHVLGPARNGAISAGFGRSHWRRDEEPLAETR